MASAAREQREFGYLNPGEHIAPVHRDEKKSIKLFAPGWVAIVLLIAIITCAQIKPTRPDEAAGKSRAEALLFMPVAYGQVNETKKLRRFTLPQEESNHRLRRGLTASKSANVWFVIVDSFPKLEDAEAEAERINQWQGDFNAEVFAPYGDSQRYSVVIAANLTLERANAARQKAANIGVRTSLWTFPK